MNLALLTKLFGTSKQWHGACTVILDAEASIQTTGADAIMNAGAKVYAPRLISGRVAADSACFLPDEQTLVLIQVVKIRQATGEDLARQTVLVVDPAHIACIEFGDTSPLKSLGLAEPPPPSKSGKS